MLATLWNSIGKILFVAVVLVALWCLWLWQPERQVRLHQRHMLDAAGKRDWAKLNAMLAADFRTPAGHDKTMALQQANEVLRQFFTLEFLDSETEITVNGQSGQVRTRLRLEGKGSPIAEMAKSLLDESKEPFVFTWKHVSWKPWDWQLVSADHPIIRLSGDF